MGKSETAVEIIPADEKHPAADNALPTTAADKEHPAADDALPTTTADKEHPTVNDDVVTEVIAGIRAAQAKHGFALSRDIGQLVVEKFYDGDITAFRKRGPKDASLRKLAEHPDLPMSSTGLYNALATYELLERLPDVYASKQLTPTHVRAVLPLPPPEQEKLLKRAEKKGMTVRELEEEARKVKARTKKSAGGRPRLPRFVKTINALRKYVDSDDDLFGDLDAVEKLDAEEAEALWKTVTGLKLKCEELQKLLQASVPGFTRTAN